MRTLPASLVARAEPIAGESLLSLVARACRANHFTHLDDLFRLAGYEQKAAFAPFTAFDHAAPLAALLGVELAEGERRLHLAVAGDADSTVIRWGGVKMERRFVEARRRRVAPAGLAASGHHRLSWTHRGLTFCPETLQTLVSSCHRCGQPLGWNRTRGPDRCEHCFADLREAAAAMAPDDLAASLRSAGRLISEDAAIRQRALDDLPEPFRGWDPGEVFSAICELGAAWEHPGEGRGSEVCRAVSEGRMERLSPAVIAAGYDVVTGWPSSFERLAARTWQARVDSDEGASASLRRFGVLGRHIDARLEPTRFRRLIREHLPLASAASGLTRKGATPSGAQRATLTLTEAQTQFGVTKAVLGRLAPDGESYVSGRLGRGGAIALDPVRLERAVEALRACVDPAAAAAKLGVPEYVLSAFVKRRWLSRCEDQDAELLAGAEPLITRRSLDAFVGWMERTPPSGGGDWTPLRKTLARRFSPVAWAAAFEAIGKRRISLLEVDGGRSGGLSNRLIVDSEEVAAYLSGERPQPVPRGPITVNADAAGLLLGMPGIYVAELIQAGFIGPVQTGRSWTILLSEVRDFDRSFITSADPLWEAQLGRGNRYNLAYAPTGTRRTRHLRVCQRTAFEELTGEQTAAPRSTKRRSPREAISKRFAALSASIEEKPRDDRLPPNLSDYLAKARADLGVANSPAS